MKTKLLHVASVCISFVAAAAEFDEQLVGVRTMSTVVEAAGLPGLLDAVRKQQLATPAIRSAFWVSEIAPDRVEELRYENAKRDFGKALAIAFDKYATTLQTKKTAEDRVAQVELLLPLSEWLKAKRSYGNLLLLTRAENMSAIAIGHLVANPTFELGRAEGFLSRLMNGAEHAGIRSDVLNEEARREIVPKTLGDASQRTRVLELAWSRGFTAVRQWQRKHGSNESSEEAIRGKIDRELRIFCDDEHYRGAPRTVTGLWELKIHHSTCVYGGIDFAQRTVQRMALFRRKVGGFPEKVPSWWHEGDLVFSRRSAAFQSAWEPFQKEFGNAYASAATVLDMIDADRFYDQDTGIVLGIRGFD